MGDRVRKAFGRCIIFIRSAAQSQLPHFVLVCVMSRRKPGRASQLKMLRARTAIPCRALLSRSYASATSPHALVFLEHNNDGITSGSLSALTAATKLGGQVTGILVGGLEQVPNAVEKAKTYGHRDPFPNVPSDVS